MKEKIIKDLVHGYITVDDNISVIIDHPSFQRLKNISQLTAHHLYPSANHTRFEHSLGVMHLADLFFEKIKKDAKASSIVNIDELGLNLKLAALLHDVGHGPFSHLGESFYDLDLIKEKIKEKDESIYNILDKGAKHEFMSCFIILDNFSALLDSIEEYKEIINYELICRIITGNKYSQKDNWFENILIEIVNSSSVDVDKLDYLMRDNHMCGNVAPKINFERLVMSLIIDDEKSLSYKPLGLSSLVSIKDSRDM